MENIQNYLFKYETPKSKATSERASIIEQFVIEINRERIGTKIKPIEAKAVVFKLTHVKEKSELYDFLNKCKRYKAEKGSFGKCFFGCLKLTKS